MSTQETYELDGSTRFDFPHPVRDPQQLTVEVRPGSVVPSSDYEVVGYGPNATGVTIYYPDAPSDPDLELRITRFTEPDRVTRFSDGTPVQPKALDAEFDNLFQLYVDMPNYVDLAEDWASKGEDEEVEDGKYSAFHWAQKAQEWAEKPEDEETYDGGYSALHYSAKAEKSADDASTSEGNAADSESNAATSESNAADSESEAASHRDKAEEWAEKPEGEEVEDGKYSARHHSAKAEEWAEKPEDEEVEDGKYSARHHSAKAEGHSSDASDSAGAAESSANAAADSASAAESSANDAADSASAAESSANDAADSASAASDSADSAEDHYQSTKDISRHYLGVHSSDPSEDPNDGGDLEDGDFYFNRDDETLRFYQDGGWYYTGNISVSTDADADTVAKRDGDGATSVATATKGSHAIRSDQISPSHLRKGKREAIFAPTNDNQDLEVRHDIYVGVDGRIRKISEGTSVSKSEVFLGGGTDYAIWMVPGGDLVLYESMSSAPESGAVLVGGIHYADGSIADLDPDGDWSNHSGGDDTRQFNKYSAWDLKWRPTVSDPRGLTLVAESFWCGIYLLAADHMTGVVHRTGTEPARDDDPPQNPYDENGGRYDSANFFNVSEALAYHGFQNLNIQEFQLAAIGVKEEASRGSDPELTGIREKNEGSDNPDEAFTSHWGCIQMTGVIRPWSRDMIATSSNENTSGLEGRGGRNRYDRAVNLGQGWDSGSESGSRATRSDSVWGSLSGIGGRGRAGHLILV